MRASICASRQRAELQQLEQQAAEVREHRARHGAPLRRRARRKRVRQVRRARCGGESRRRRTRRGRARRRRRAPPASAAGGRTPRDDARERTARAGCLTGLPRHSAANGVRQARARPRSHEPRTASLGLDRDLHRQRGPPGLLSDPHRILLRRHHDLARASCAALLMLAEVLRREPVMVGKRELARRRSSPARASARKKRSGRAMPATATTRAPAGAGASPSPSGRSGPNRSLHA